MSDTPDKNNNLEVDESYWNWKEFKTNVVKLRMPGRTHPCGDGASWILSINGFESWTASLTVIFPRPIIPLFRPEPSRNFMFVVAMHHRFCPVDLVQPQRALCVRFSGSHGGKTLHCRADAKPARYSSDAFMLFVIFHAFKVFFGGSFYRIALAGVGYRNYRAAYYLV
jgi:hypothetical protein